MKNIVLIGLMGSGKTLISKDLAKKLHKERFSSDEMIETKEQCSITKLVQDKGWPYFRALEHAVIKDLSQKKGIIIDCGGGVVLDPANVELLKKNGTIFHLDAAPDVLFARLKNDKSRPLISGPNPQARLKELYEERLPLYNQAADVTVDASDASLQKPIVEILKKVS
jgi:shikimate kinase